MDRRVGVAAFLLGCSAGLLFDLLTERSHWVSFLIVVGVSFAVRALAELGSRLRG